MNEVKQLSAMSTRCRSTLY